jgi:putative aldouronate transport system permease protein
MLLYYGVYHWNAWFDAMVYLRERALFPLQLVLREILIVNDTANMSMGTGLSDQEQVGESIKYATIMVATVPILMVYPFLQ